MDLNKPVKISFNSTQVRRRKLKIAAANTGMSQTDLLNHLVDTYCNEQKPTDDAPESGLPESDLNDPYLNFCRELGKLIVSMPEYTGTGISYIAAEQWYMSIGGMNFGKLYRSFKGNLWQAWNYIRD